MEVSPSELDNLLLCILQDLKKYVSLKKEFYDIFSDVSILLQINM